MAINPKLVQHGSVGGTPINVDMARIEHGAPVKVHLTANYALLSGPGIPARPSFTGAPVAGLDYPRTIVSGTALLLLKGEADALVTAGAATYG
jgi:hypothetical protein